MTHTFSKYLAMGNKSAFKVSRDLFINKRQRLRSKYVIDHLCFLKYALDK